MIYTSTCQRFCFLLLLVLTSHAAFAQQAFQIEYSGRGARPNAIVPYGNGYFVAGTDTTSSASGSEGVLLKLAADGGPIWGKAIGGNKDDQWVAMEVTQDSNLILLGTTQSFVGTEADSGNIYIVLMDSTGTVLKSKSMGTSHKDIGYCVQETADHGFIIAGETDSLGKASAYLIKTDANLNVQWSRVYRNADYDVNVARSVVQMSGGGYALTGYSTQTTAAPEHRLFFLTTDAMGLPLNTKHFAFTDHTLYTDWGVFGEDILQNTNGNIVIVGGAGGYYTMAQQNIYSPLLMEITPSGGLVQSKSFFLNSGDCRTLSVLQSADGGYVLGGYQGNYYLSMFKTDAAISPTAQWSYYYTGANFTPRARGYSVCSTPDGGYILAGSLESGTAMRLVKTDALGQSGCEESVPFGVAGASPISLAETATTWTSFADADTFPTATIAGGRNVPYQIRCGIVGTTAELASNSLELFPNPCAGRLHVRAVGCEGLSVTNMLGETVMEITIQESELTELELNVANLAAGIYCVRGGGMMQRFLKQ